MVVHKASACGYQGQACGRDRRPAKGIGHSQCRPSEALGGYKPLKQAQMEGQPRGGKTADRSHLFKQFKQAARSNGVPGGAVLQGKAHFGSVFTRRPSVRPWFCVHSLHEPSHRGGDELLVQLEQKYDPLGFSPKASLAISHINCAVQLAMCFHQLRRHAV